MKQCNRTKLLCHLGCGDGGCRDELTARHIQHIPLTILNTGIDHVEIRDDSKILTATWDCTNLVLCVQVHPTGAIRQRKIWFRKEGDISEAGEYFTTFQLATDPNGGFQLVHVFIED